MKIAALNFKNINFRANKMPKKEAQFLKKELLSYPQADIFTHESTDKDAINSALAISNFLEKYGVKPRIVISGKADLLDIRDNSKEIIQAQDYVFDRPDAANICVDFSKVERLSEKILNQINFDSDSVYCFDHHTDTDIGQSRMIFDKPQNTSNITSYAPIYVDSSAKSATSVIYRFFEALDEEYDNLCALEMFYGLTSDCYKKGLVEIDGTKGTIEAKHVLKRDKNAIEIFNKLKSSLTDEQIASIAKNVDIMSTLSKEEKIFYRSLFRKTQTSNDGKTAYVVLPLNDKQWKKLGEDNKRTSAIINYYRQTVLKNNKEIENAIVFYKSGENYRLSIHSKDDLNDFYNNSEKLIKNKTFSIGGHKNRGGGKIKSSNPDECKKFVFEIIDVISI